MNDLAAVVMKKGKDEGLERVHHVAFATQDNKAGKYTGIAYSDDGMMTGIQESFSINHLFAVTGTNNYRKVIPAIEADSALIYQLHIFPGKLDMHSIPPVIRGCNGQSIAVAQNGLISNRDKLGAILGKKFRFDSELIAEILCDALRETKSIVPAIRKTMETIEGHYIVLVLHEDALYVFGDPYGTTPIVFGETEDAYITTTETCGLDAIGARYHNWYRPGTITEISKLGIREHEGKREICRKPCAFLFGLFYRPDSLIPYSDFGKCQSLSLLREEWGAGLAEQCRIEADLVIAKPDSGRYYAMGFARASGVPYGEGFVKNRYHVESVPAPKGIPSLKIRYNPIVVIIKGKRLIIVDDSFLTGRSRSEIVGMSKEAGARKIHFCFCTPLVVRECMKGYKQFGERDLVALRMNPDEITRHIGADGFWVIDYNRWIEVASRFGISEDNICTDCFLKN